MKMNITIKRDCGNQESYILKKEMFIGEWMFDMETVNGNAFKITRYNSELQDIECLICKESVSIF